MDFKEEFSKALQSESESVYDSFLKFSRNALPQDTQQRYEYLRSKEGRFIARDQADVDVYVDKVAQKHIPKFKWLYETLFKFQ